MGQKSQIQISNFIGWLPLTTQPVNLSPSAEFAFHSNRRGRGRHSQQVQQQQHEGRGKWAFSPLRCVGLQQPPMRMRIRMRGKRSTEKCPHPKSVIPNSNPKCPFPYSFLQIPLSSIICRPPNPFLLLLYPPFLKWMTGRGELTGGGPTQTHTNP
jgi:hypothetical protein